MIIRQVWQGWWELVNVQTGQVVARSWSEEEIRKQMEASK